MTSSVFPAHHHRDSCWVFFGHRCRGEIWNRTAKERVMGTFPLLEEWHEERHEVALLLPGLTWALAVRSGSSIPSSSNVFLVSLARRSYEWHSSSFSLGCSVLLGAAVHSHDASWVLGAGWCAVQSRTSFSRGERCQNKMRCFHVQVSGVRRRPVCCFGKDGRDLKFSTALTSDFQQWLKPVSVFEFILKA